MLQLIAHLTLLWPSQAVWAPKPSHSALSPAYIGGLVARDNSTLDDVELQTSQKYGVCASASIPLLGSGFEVAIGVAGSYSLTSGAVDTMSFAVSGYLGVGISSAKFGVEGQFTVELESQAKLDATGALGLLTQAFVEIGKATFADSEVGQFLGLQSDAAKASTYISTLKNKITALGTAAKYADVSERNLINAYTELFQNYAESFQRKCPTKAMMRSKKREGGNIHNFWDAGDKDHSYCGKMPGCDDGYPCTNRATKYVKALKCPKTEASALRIANAEAGGNFHAKWDAGSATGDYCDKPSGWSAPRPDYIKMDTRNWFSEWNIPLAEDYPFLRTLEDFGSNKQAYLNMAMEHFTLHFLGKARDTTSGFFWTSSMKCSQSIDLNYYMNNLRYTKRSGVSYNALELAMFRVCEFMKSGTLLPADKMSDTTGIFNSDNAAVKNFRRMARLLVPSVFKLPEKLAEASTQSAKNKLYKDFNRKMRNYALHPLSHTSTFNHMMAIVAQKPDAMEKSLKDIFASTNPTVKTCQSTVQVTKVEASVRAAFTVGAPNYCAGDAVLDVGVNLFKKTWKPDKNKNCELTGETSKGFLFGINFAYNFGGMLALSGSGEYDVQAKEAEIELVLSLRDDQFKGNSLFSKPVVKTLLLSKDGQLGLIVSTAMGMSNRAFTGSDDGKTKTATDVVYNAGKDLFQQVLVDNLGKDMRTKLTNKINGVVGSITTKIAEKVGSLLGIPMAGATTAYGYDIKAKVKIDLSEPALKKAKFTFSYIEETSVEAAVGPGLGSAAMSYSNATAFTFIYKS